MNNTQEIRDALEDAANHILAAASTKSGDVELGMVLAGAVVLKMALRMKIEATKSLDICGMAANQQEKAVC